MCKGDLCTQDECCDEGETECRMGLCSAVMENGTAVPFSLRSEGGHPRTCTGVGCSRSHCCERLEIRELLTCHECVAPGLNASSEGLQVGDPVECGGQRCIFQAAGVAPGKIVVCCHEDKEPLDFWAVAEQRWAPSEPAAGGRVLCLLAGTAALLGVALTIGALVSRSTSHRTFAQVPGQERFLVVTDVKE